MCAKAFYNFINKDTPGMKFNLIKALCLDAPKSTLNFYTLFFAGEFRECDDKRQNLDKI